MAENLEEVRILDYRVELNKEIKNWIISQEEIPNYFWGKLKDVSSQTTFRELLNKVRKELYAIYGRKRDKARSFTDSRFTPLSKMLERGMISCGALTNIFGTVLRKFGIPVKFIHGRLKHQTGEDRHAWLEVYNPLKKKWFEIDPTYPDFKMKPDAKRIKVYHDWEELKKDYDEGNF